MHNDLMKWCQQHNIILRSKDIFWKNFKMYAKESPDEFKETFKYGASDASCCICDIMYKLELPGFDYPMVYVTLDILCKKEKIGWFRQIYNIDGSEFDEYFVIY